MLENYKDVLTVRELCEALQVGKSKIYELLKEGEIKSIRIGTKIIIPKKNVIEFLSQ